MDESGVRVVNIVDFIKANGCTCFRAGKDIDPGEVAITIQGVRVTLHPGVMCHTTETIVRGTGRRPRIARHRRPWLRARRLAMRRTGKPPENWRMTYVACRGCGASANTPDRLEGAW